jgi:hypothetical protein
MKCTRCQAEIADKAIVCYRCGTPTAIPAPPERPAAGAQGLGPITIIIILVVLAALVAAGYLFLT